MKSTPEVNTVNPVFADKRKGKYFLFRRFFPERVFSAPCPAKAIQRRHEKFMMN